MVVSENLKTINLLHTNNKRIGEMDRTPNCRRLAINIRIENTFDVPPFDGTITECSRYN